MQNKLQLATPLLPAPVQQSGIRVTKSSSGVPAGRRHSFRATTACRATTSRTTSSRTSRTRSAASTASATSTCSARSTRCASGSTRTSSTTYALTPVDVSNAMLEPERAGRRAASSADTPAPDGAALQRDDHRSDAAAHARGVRQHPAEGRPTARRCACATSRASSSAPETYIIDSRYNGQPCVRHRHPARARRERARRPRRRCARGSTSWRRIFRPG